MNCFETAQLKFVTVLLYQFEVIFKKELLKFYPLTGASICKQTTLAMASSVFVI